MFKHKSKSVIDEDNFDRFKNPLTVIVNPGSLIIPSEALWKFYWDLFITVLLMTTPYVGYLHCDASPFSLLVWRVYVVSRILLDRLLLHGWHLPLFFHVHPRDWKHGWNLWQERNSCKLHKNLILFWFTIDLLSVLPFHVLFESYE